MRVASEVLIALLNSLWQAALVAGVVWLALRFLRVNAATRYAIWWAVLAVTLALPAAPRVMTWWHAQGQAAVEGVVMPAVPRLSIAPILEEQTAIVTLKEERAARWPGWVMAAWAALCLFRLS